MSDIKAIIVVVMLLLTTGVGVMQGSKLIKPKATCSDIFGFLAETREMEKLTISIMEKHREIKLPRKIPQAVVGADIRPVA